MKPRMPTWKIGLIGPAVALIMLGAGEPSETPRGGIAAVSARPTIPTEPGPPPPALPDEGREPEHAALAIAPGPALGTPLVPGQVILPIDLPDALRLAGARDLDIA